jgi:beta-glucosidase/6-phospho-beta-glucosidase/beta-galactosidase
VPSLLPRRKFQKSQGGKIGITLNLDWSFPLNASSPLDVAAAERRNEFMFGWFADPIFFGSYPSSMKAAAGERLPLFTPPERDRLVGSLDFLGFNHYSSWYVAEDSSGLGGEQRRATGDWFADQRTVVR